MNSGLADYRPEIVGHAGAGGHFPGNSRLAFQRALALGVDRIECDVQPSADGELVLIHDNTVATSRGRILVHLLTTDEIRRAMPGVLLLDDLVELAAGRVPLMLDIKGGADAAPYIAAIERLGLAAESSVSCPSGKTLRRLRRAFPQMRLGLSRGHFSSGMPTPPGRFAATHVARPVMVLPLIPALITARASEVMLYHRVATPHLIVAVHRIGRWVNLWTADQPADVARAISLRPDGIITNFPDRVRVELEQLT